MSRASHLPNKIQQGPTHALPMWLFFHSLFQFNYYPQFQTFLLIISQLVSNILEIGAKSEQKKVKSLKHELVLIEFCLAKEVQHIFLKCGNCTNSLWFCVVLFWKLTSSDFLLHFLQFFGMPCISLFLHQNYHPPVPGKVEDVVWESSPCSKLSDLADFLNTLLISFRSITI